MPSGGHVYAHSMWRTGSTALARAFLDNESYLVFYEPFHEFCGSVTDILEQQKRQSGVTKILNHPEWIGGYFDNFLFLDPGTNKSLYELYDRSCAVESVYRDAPSDLALEYIAACKRVAEAQGRRAFFSFCRSGTQQRAIPHSDMDFKFYLNREPRSQFLSYDYPINDYFLPATLMQLAHSPNIQVFLHKLIRNSPNRAFITLTHRMSGNSAYQEFSWARRMSRGLNRKDAYRIFYLSYELTKRAARASGLDFFTIDSLCNEDRVLFEKKYNVSLTRLFPNVRATIHPEEYEEIENEVLYVLGNYLSRPA
jgi:hypothetical protein